MEKQSCTWVPQGSPNTQDYFLLVISILKVQYGSLV